MDYSVKAIQAQQLYKVQPVALNEEKQNNKNAQQQQMIGLNPFSGNKYTPMHPSVENSPVLGRSLDLLS